MFRCETSNFHISYKKCNPRESKGYKNDYGETIEPTEYSLPVTEYIYHNIIEIENEYDNDKNTVVNNLIHMGLSEKFANYDSKFATRFKDLKQIKPQLTIPLSDVFYNDLNNIADIIGLQTNQLISLIIGNYLIQHYKEYDDDVYVDENGNLYNGIW